MKILDFSPGDRKVPPFFNNKLPEDLSKISPKKRMWVFSSILLPLILRANNTIKKEHSDTLTLLNELSTLNQVDLDFLLATLKKYKIAQKKRDTEWLRALSENDQKQIIYQINLKIQPVSPSLALAQAALESGWGTSRFVRLANNIFGQHTTSSRYGIRPQNWSGAHNQNIKIFSSVCHSIEAYMLNLNRNSAYKAYRKIRIKHPHKPQFHIYGFKKYSAIGEEYVKRLRSMFFTYKFIQYADAFLDSSHRLDRLSQLKSFYIY